jgi:5-methylcytosine-specific restriction endonuclease McrA
VSPFVHYDAAPANPRERIYDLDGGRCVGCGARLRRGGSTWEWQVHHAIRAQTLKRRGIGPRSRRALAVCVLLCRRCHERHESRTAPIALERLPPRVVAAADALGPWAEDLLRVYHPPGAAAEPPA